ADPSSRQPEHGAAGPVHPRDEQLQRMDRRAAVRVVERVRPEKRGELAGFRRSRSGQVHAYASVGKGARRLLRGLWPEWRAAACRAGLPDPAVRARLGSALQREVPETYQADGPALPRLE